MLFYHFHPVPKRPLETWIVNVFYFVSNNQNIFVLLIFFFQIVNGVLTKFVHFDVFLNNFGICKTLTKSTEATAQLRWKRHRWLACHHIACRAPYTVSIRTTKENTLRVSLTALYVALFKYNSIQHCCQTLDNIWSHKHIHMFFQMTFGILKEKK